MATHFGGATSNQQAANALPRSGYVASIDGLRAVAVLSVMAYHLKSAWLPGGFAGVDVFFVISGYVISRSMLDLDNRNFFTFAAAFYARRVRRILPALLGCLGVASLLKTMLIPDSWLSQTTHKTADWAVWGLSNYFLSHFGDKYFDSRAAYNPFVHTWSLGVEEQFYWVYPVIFYVWLKAGRPTWLLGGLLVASLGYCAYATSNDSIAAYYSLPSRFWEMAAGALLLQGQMSGFNFGVRLQSLVGILVIGSAFVFTSADAFPFPWALLAVLGSFLTINAVTRPGHDGLVSRWLASPICVWLGKRSYSLYLWHWIVYVLFRWTVGLDHAGQQVMAVLLTVALSDLSYRIVETPFRRGFQSVAPLTTVAAGVACMLLTWQIINAVDSRGYRLSLSVTRNSAVWYPGWSAPPGDSACPAALAEHPFGGGILQAASHTGCATRMLFVSGNSHAVAYSSMLAKLGSFQPTDVRLYFLSGCALFDLRIPMNQTSPNCQRFFANVLADIRSRAKRGDILFLPSLRLDRFADEYVLFSEQDVRRKMLSEDARAKAFEAIEEAAPLLSELTRRGVRVIFEAPKPIFRAPPFRCSDWFNRHNPICQAGFTVSRQDLLAYREPIMREFQTLALSVPIDVWDPFDVICPEEACSAVRKDGTPLFFDGDHLSGAANDLLYPSFAAFIGEPVRSGFIANPGTL